jgi:hypothetical protein
VETCIGRRTSRSAAVEAVCGKWGLMARWKRKRLHLTSIDGRVAESSRQLAANTLESVDLKVVDSSEMSYISQTKVKALYANMSRSRHSASTGMSAETAVDLQVVKAKVGVNRDSTSASSIHHQAHDWTRSAFARGQIRLVRDAAPGAYVAVRMPLHCGTLMVGHDQYPDTVWWRGSYGGYVMALTGHVRNVLSDNVERIESATWIPSREGSYRQVVEALVADSDRDQVQWSGGQRLSHIDSDWGTHLQILMQCANHRGTDRGEYLWKQWADLVFRCDDIVNDYQGVPVLAGSPVWVKKVPHYCYGWYEVVPAAYRGMDRRLLPSYYAEWSGSRWTGMIGGISGLRRRPDPAVFPDIGSLPAKPASPIPNASSWTSTPVRERLEAEYHAAREVERKRVGLPPDPVFISAEQAGEDTLELFEIPRLPR